MPSFGNRSLLRLRGVAQRVPTSARRASTTAPVVGAQREAPLRPSAFASSSKVTLEAFFDNKNDDSLWAGMNFVRDEELVSALLTVQRHQSTTHHQNQAHESWIDPASAYLGLRSSGLYSHYLTAALLPHIRTLYANLRPSGMHQMLVSDLLLRNPDAHALREIIQEEAEWQAHNDPNALRRGLIIKVYHTIAGPLRRRIVPRLSRAANVMVARALMRDNDTELLPDIFYEIVYTIEWEPLYMWPLLEIIACLARNGKASDALRLLQYPVSLGKLPAEAVEPIDMNHPQAATILVQSAVVRTLLAWNFDYRAQRITTDLVQTLVESKPSPSACDLVLTACRAAAITRKPGQVEWAGNVLLQFVNDKRFPQVDSNTLDIYLDALSTKDALNFYSALPPMDHAPPGPRHVARMALANPTRELLGRLVMDLRRTHVDASSAIPGVLRALAGARLLRFVKHAYNEWLSTHPYLDSHTTVTLVRAFTRGARSAANTAFARQILADYLKTTARWVPPEIAATTTLHAYTLIGKVDGDRSVVAAESEQIKALIAAVGEHKARGHLRTVALKYPTLAHRLAQITRANGIELDTMGVNIAAACSGRDWGSLAIMNKVDLQPSEEAYLLALRAMRGRKMAKALRLFADAVKAYPFEPTLVPTMAALLSRFEAGKHWDPGFAVVQACLPVVSEDVVEHVSVFLSALNRDAREKADDYVRLSEQVADELAAARPDGKYVRLAAEYRTRLRAVVDAWDKHAPAVVQLVAGLEPTPRALLGAMMESVGVTVRSVGALVADQTGEEAVVEVVQVETEAEAGAGEIAPAPATPLST